MSTARSNTAGAHELRCRYASKRCENPRAVKRNGEMHRLCAIHRERANLNQKKMDQRKKEGARRSESDDMEDDEQEGQLRLQDENDRASQAANAELNDKQDDNGDDDNDFDDEFDVSSLDISKLNPDELDDKEIEELQALVVAGQLQQITDGAEPRIDP